MKRMRHLRLRNAERYNTWLGRQQQQQKQQQSQAVKIKQLTRNLLK